MRRLIHCILRRWNYGELHGKIKNSKQTSENTGYRTGLEGGLLSTPSVDAQREKFRDFLSGLFEKTHDDETLSPLEWILVRDTIRVLLTILSPRSERLCGLQFSAIYERLALQGKSQGHPETHPRFFCRVGASAQGAHGKSGFIPKKSRALRSTKGKKPLN